MGAFDDAIADAAAVWYGSDMADDLTYNGVRILGHIEPTGGEAGNVRKLTAKAHVRKSDVAAPAYRDQIEDENGVVWRVVGPIPLAQTSIDWTLNVESQVAPVPGK